MSCFDDATLVACIDGSLADGERRTVLDHADDCATCRQLLVASARALLPDPDGVMPRRAGDAIGRYRIVARIGGGMMGEVFAAVDPQLGRKVAIKVLRRDSAADGADDAEDRSTRLLAEAQALARVSHPNVVGIYEVGTVAGHLFIAMELLDGGTLTRWLGLGRAWRDIVAAFVAAGQGLAAVHAAGMVHRDFKPDNVLVGGDGRMRVTDFGLARISGEPSPPRPPARDLCIETAALTRTGALVGTPRYMAPEQLRGETAKAASDQFAFCVALFEALYGTPPFAGATLSALAQAIAARQIALANPARVPRGLRDVVVRGLSPDVSARHRSMPELLARLQRATHVRRRWLALLPVGVIVAALAGVQIYRLARRVPGCDAAAAAMRATWGPATRARFLAQAAPADVDTANATARHFDWYVERWGAARDQICRPEASADARAAAALGVACLQERTQSFARVSGAVAIEDDDLPALDRCLQLAKLQASVDRARVVADYARLDKTLMQARTDHAKEALPAFDALVTDARTVGFGPLLAETLVDDARLRAHSMDYQGARPLLYDAVRVADAAGDDPLRVAALIQLVQLSGHGGVSPDEAETLATLGEAALGRIDDDYAKSLLLGGLESERMRLAQYPAARELVLQRLQLERKLYGPESARAAMALQHLGSVERMLGHYRESEQVLRQALAIVDRRGASGSVLATVLLELSSALTWQGKLDEAVPLSARALAVDEQIFGADSPRLVDPLTRLASAILISGKPDEAHPHFVRALSIAERKLSSNDGLITNLLQTLAWDELERGDLQAADGDARRALGFVEKSHNRYATATAKPLLLLADVMTRQKRHGEALAACDRALAIEEHDLGPSHPDTAYAYMRRGETLLAAGRARESLAPFEHALLLMSKGDAEPIDRGDLDLGLAKALLATHGDRARVTQLGNDAAANYRDGGVRYGRRPAAAAAFLAQLQSLP
jgi:tetratricopeptide (TPR) repeat protein/tRNA A-37 threonylcarbamoyl transferase component Bud32